MKICNVFSNKIYIVFSNKDTTLARKVINEYADKDADKTTHFNSEADLGSLG